MKSYFRRESCRSPFYSSEADLATDMGGIGMVIAHEISHAFDSSGAMYDEKGNYKMWWTEEDLENFRALAGKVADYYDGQEGFEGRFVNGEQTLGENIADLGSLSCVTSIVGDDTDGLRALFTRFATIWASKYTDEAMIRRLNTDVHSPAKVRSTRFCATPTHFTWPILSSGRVTKCISRRNSGLESGRKWLSGPVLGARFV